jgi:hypothetical protein
LIYQRKVTVHPEITGDLLLKLLLITDGLADARGDDVDRVIGRELTKSVFRINEMNRMGMIVDLSYVSKNVVIDVLRGSSEKGWSRSLAPPIFSHSIAYALCPYSRHVTDEVLRLVKEQGALVVINFVTGFVSCKAGKHKNGLPDPVPKGATMEKVMERIWHVVAANRLLLRWHQRRFAGIRSTPEGLDDAIEGFLEEFSPRVEGGCEPAAKLQKTIEDDITHLAESILSSCRRSSTQ